MQKVPLSLLADDCSVPFCLLSVLAFLRVRPAINFVICGPSRLGFQRLLLTQPGLPILWDTLCEMVEMVHDEGMPFGKG